MKGGTEARVHTEACLLGRLGCPGIFVVSDKKWCQTLKIKKKQDQGGQRCVLQQFFHVPFFYSFYLSIAYFFLLVAPSSSLLFSLPHCSFLFLIAFFSWSLLPPRRSFLLAPSSLKTKENRRITNNKHRWMKSVFIPLDT